MPWENFTPKQSETNEISSQKSNILTDIFKCEKCDFQTKQMHHLNTHIQQHTDCGVCGKSFQGRNKNRSLVNHLKTHQDKAVKQKSEKKFECEYCNKNYTTKQSLQIHQRQNCNAHLQKQNL